MNFVFQKRDVVLPILLPKLASPIDQVPSEGKEDTEARQDDGEESRAVVRVEFLDDRETS